MNNIETNSELILDSSEFEFTLLIQEIEKNGIIKNIFMSTSYRRELKKFKEKKYDFLKKTTVKSNISKIENKLIIYDLLKRTISYLQISLILICLNIYLFKGVNIISIVFLVMFLLIFFFIYIFLSIRTLKS